MLTSLFIRVVVWVSELLLEPVVWGWERGPLFVAWYSSAYMNPDYPYQLLKHECFDILIWNYQLVRLERDEEV